MFIFLDFDGVLRRLTSDPARLDRDCVQQFELAVRPIPDVKIIISSTWRLVMSLGELQKLFSTEVASLIVGVTPEVHERLAHSRYNEIQKYLRAQNLENYPWIAIDDEADNFPNKTNLLLTDPAKGFDSLCTSRLWEYALTK